MASEASTNGNVGRGGVQGVAKLRFDVRTARATTLEQTPALELELVVRERTTRPIYAMSLASEILIEPARRRYDGATWARLEDLFGDPDTAAETARTLFWRRVDTPVRSFERETTVALTFPCDIAPDLVATRYLYAVHDGTIPLVLRFTGSVFYRDPEGGLELAQLSWASRARFELPAELWRAAIQSMHGRGAWLRFGNQIMERVRRQRLARGLPSFEVTVAALASRGREEERTA